MTYTGNTEAIKAAYDVRKVRSDFPILSRPVRGKKLVYLDNAATSQKPASVIKTLSTYYESMNANIHRGVHALSEEATEAYEVVRKKVRQFIGARDSREIVFVRGTTEAINLVARSFARPRLGAGDEILISGLEHHSNIVPWQMLCGETGCTLKVVPLNDAGELIQEEYERLLTGRTKIVALGHVSNALGTINPVKPMIDAAHQKGIPVLIDGAQAVPHMRVDVRELDADFYAFSAHKMFGPTGVGVLVGKAELLEEMPPYQGGGDMIKSVSFEKTVYNDIPHKFEAGTPNIAGVIGLGAAIDYLASLDSTALEAYEHDLLEHATIEVMRLGNIRIIGTARAKAGVLSFVVDGVHPHDVGTILDQEGIAVRTGHHCAQPVMERFGVPATVRASFAFYNTREEIGALVNGLEKVKEMFA